MDIRTRISGSAGRRLVAVIGLLWAGAASAGGGVILEDDTCIITIGFYTAHFTAYQPDTSGNEEFCEDLPDIGESIFVLDYLHQSLKEVPVDFRVIRNVTGQGRFAAWEDIEKLTDIDAHTVFYQEPLVRADGSYRVNFPFPETGDYIGIVTAGHPSNDNIYNSVFPFSVGVKRFPLWLVFVAFGVVFAILARMALKGRGT